jgi:hypothetical protein
MEAASIEQNTLGDNILSVSKLYFLNHMGSVVFMWKIVCTDVTWLDRHFRVANPAAWAKNFNVQMDGQGRPTKVSLVSTTGNYNMPRPEDIVGGGIISE